MLKGLVITPPVVGRISIGRVVERNGKRLPEKDDQFTLTSQVQNRDGWVLHPLDELLRRDSGGKLRSIPVRLLFNDPSLNLRADYSVFDRRTGRPMCVGNGESCRRRDGEEGIETFPCVGPDLCRFANGECKAYARFNAVIGDGEEDALGSFVLRTTSFNTIRTIAARLQYFSGLGWTTGLHAARAQAPGKEHGDEPSHGDLLRRSGRAIGDDAGTGNRRGPSEGCAAQGQWV